MSDNYDYQPVVEDAGETIGETLTEMVDNVSEIVSENIDTEQITEQISETVESVQELLPEVINNEETPKFGYDIVDDPVIQRLNNTDQGYTGPIVIILVILIIIGGVVGYFIYRRKQLTAIPQSDPEKDDVEAGVATEEEQNLNEQYDTTVKAEQL